MIRLCNDYLRLIFFCGGLLMGIQIPAFVDQYAKRVDAQLSEAMLIFAGFQQTAERYFNGDMQALISHYQQSDDQVFKHDAQNIGFIRHRVTRLKTEAAAMQQSAFLRVMHVLFTPDPKVRQDTFEHYSYVVLLNAQAFFWGLGMAFILAVFIDLLQGVLGKGLKQVKLLLEAKINHE
ncbi:DUF2937 family protein [Paraglaciecola aestuariivivens]